MESDYIKGRGAQFNAKNKFLVQQYVHEHHEGIDEMMTLNKSTRVYYEYPKKIVNQVKSPDLAFSLSMNPYQGCEHGCIYCYARNSHEYWGFSAGTDFESKIIVKPDAPKLLEKELLKKSWKPLPIMLSGNTDCYQPLERKFKITQQLLKVLVKYQNPVGIITKNSLILRDLNLLQALSENNLVKVSISITTLNEKLRLKLEPRTANCYKRLKVIEKLAAAKIPVGVMVAPIIPGLNNHEMPTIMKKAAEAGAMGAGMTMVRLNGAIQYLFKDWLEKNFPDRFNKVWNQISQIHDGQVNDSEWGRRMTGTGPLAEAITKLFKTSLNKYYSGKSMPAYDTTRFRKSGMMNLF
ncbi:PA0069 family radical SAM protein [Fulvivirgaceae bacterium BMA12]|uniref:PA0069 family radical SAM protein n=1 Tax=Agaribacillus aureus TaxID=3051825 RepID=A0ABT8LIR6_9BACT|nr:PA0069 family radical SAM protein [Fulvivirgaceae bacterium BMA12]